MNLLLGLLGGPAQRGWRHYPGGGYAPRSNPSGSPRRGRPATGSTRCPRGPARTVDCLWARHSPLWSQRRPVGRSLRHSRPRARDQNWSRGPQTSHPLAACPGATARARTALEDLERLTVTSSRPGSSLPRIVFSASFPSQPTISRLLPTSSLTLFLYLLQFASLRTGTFFCCGVGVPASVLLRTAALLPVRETRSSLSRVHLLQYIADNSDLSRH